MAELAEMQAGTVIKSEDVMIFIKDTESYFRLEHTTEFEITLDTETESIKFISKKNSTEFSKSTSIKTSNDLYTIKGEKDFEYFFPLWLKVPTEGQPKPIEVLIVYTASGEPSGGFEAWQCLETNVVFTSYNTVDSKLNYDFNFGEITNGKVTISGDQPSFVEA